MTERKERNCFVVCMGGNGSMVMESLIHMCAVNVMSIDHLYALVIDIDAGNGNLNRVNKLYQAYLKAKDLLIKQDTDHYFKTEMNLYAWTPQHMDETEHNTLSGMISDSAESAWLSRLFFTSEELAHDIPVGFKGHPNIGVLFLADMLKGHAADAPLQEFIDALWREQPDRLLFIGSCFGGTGAASIPMIKRFLLNALEEKAKEAKAKAEAKVMKGEPQEEIVDLDIECGLVAMLPYFNVPEAQESMAIDSKQFKDKVKTVLHYYMYDEFKADKAESLYQHVYLIGSTNRIQYPKNFSGKSLQQNPSNLITWFACTAVEQFFTEDISQKNESQLSLAWLKNTAMGWDQFSDEVFPRLEQRCAGMMQIALTYITKLSEDFRLIPNEPTPLMHAMTADLTAVQRSEFFNYVNDCLKYFSYYVDFFFQIMTHLPLDPEWVENTVQDPSGAAMEPYLNFHGTTMDTLKDTLEKYGSVNEEKYLNQMVRSLTFQRFLNAYVLCRMEQGRMSCWPVDNDSEQNTIPSDIVETILILWGRAKSNPPFSLKRLSYSQYPIHSIPLVMLLNRISASYFFPFDVTMNDLVAYVMDENTAMSGDLNNRAANMIGGLFRAIRHWQT